MNNTYQKQHSLHYIAEGKISKHFRSPLKRIQLNT